MGAVLEVTASRVITTVIATRARAPTAPTTATLAASAALLSIIGGLGPGVGGGALGRFGVITGLVVRRVPAPRAGRP